MSNTNYEHGIGSITWTGTVASHTDCSAFIDQLLMHDDGYTAAQFKRRFGIRRPTAATYHDAIASAHGFTPGLTVPELQLGDVIAIEYLTRRDNTGHIMLVVGTTQWDIAIIDSSESEHGPTDPRHKRGPSAARTARITTDLDAAIFACTRSATAQSTASPGARSGVRNSSLLKPSIY